MERAPIAFFAFNRPVHTARTLGSLLLNPEVRETTVYAFCDGARGPEDAAAVRDTRALLRDAPIPRLEIVERDENYGLARSVIEGVTFVAERHGRVIVLEDDLLLSPAFLAYMNSGLNRYESEGRVYQVAGHLHPVQLSTTADALFLPFISSWGWATWLRAWRAFDSSTERIDVLANDGALRRRFNLDGSFPYFDMLRAQARGHIDSWAVRWYASVFFRDGLALFPARSMVANIGFDGSGRHCERSETSMRDSEGSLDDRRVEVFPERVEVDEASYRRIVRMLRRRYPGPTRLTRVRAAVGRALRTLGLRRPRANPDP